jgi:hypothetical protein
MIWGSLIRGSKVKRRGQAGLCAGKEVWGDLLADRRNLLFPPSGLACVRCAAHTAGTFEWSGALAGAPWRRARVPP